MPDATALDFPTLALVRLAAAVAAGDESAQRFGMESVLAAMVDPAWVEELLLQSILMVGYPRALVAFGVWRQVSGILAPTSDTDADYARLSEWEARGVDTCSMVYGNNYEKLRRNVRGLHPAVDRWMLVEGYGRTLGRPGLDLRRRELCTVVQTAVLGTHRQLHSHLRGALHGGASFAQVESTLSAARPLVTDGEWTEIEKLWVAVRAGWSEEN